MFDISAVILAGGQSRRLGVDKAFIEIGRQALIERVRHTVASLSDDLIMVSNEPMLFRHLEARVVGDVYPGKGALGGIYSGLLAARHERALVVGCDMPFLNPELLRYMISLAAEYDVVIPHYDDFLEPLHAIYSKGCLEPMRELIEADRLRIAEVFCAGRIRYVTAEELDLFDPARLSFFNINTPEDVEHAEKLMHLRSQVQVSREDHAR